MESRDDTDRVDVAAQLLAELEEEVGLSAGQVGPVTPILLMEHPGGQVADIGCLVSTGLSFEAVQQAWRDTGNAEYDDLRLVRPDDIPALLRDAGAELLASARILLRCWLERQAA